MERFNGIAASRGVAIGKLHFFDNCQRPVQLARSDSPERELERFESARLRALKTLDDLHTQAVERVGPEDSMIFGVQQALLNDRDYISGVRDLINQEHYVAEYAVQRTGERLAQMISQLDNVYLQERSSDLLDISGRVVRQLNGELARDLSDIQGQVVLAAQDLLPSETVQLDQSKVQAFVTGGGSRTSHASILSRTMGIPAVVGLQEQLSQLRDGALVVVDGFQGVVIQDPDEATLEEYLGKQQSFLEYRRQLKRLKGAESRTLDGKKVVLCCNVNQPSEVRLVLENDGEGIGLYRSEMLCLEREEFPSEEVQFQAYREILEGMSSRRVVIRTMDLGADKKLPYLPLPAEQNPAMGCRGIRLSLLYPDYFKQQLRALLRASVYGKLAIIFPMISTLEEVREAKRLLWEVEAQLRSEGLRMERPVELGVMIETPAAALISDMLAREVDFFSIGTNDLTQYVMAADRNNSRIDSTLNDPCHPAVLRLVRIAAENARARGIWCGVCGESAADVRLTETFLRMGISELSVAPASILELRKHIRSIDLSAQPQRCPEPV